MQQLTVKRLTFHWLWPSPNDLWDKLGKQLQCSCTKSVWKKFTQNS